ncbi:cupin domain-containing protein [Emticicia sp. CRIBPO]|uniref:cupin domain-containing protein n=1 Tax=Emticicia sp. CRIBPO TaxID=2683258 RepID=UPI0014121C99|nr:cupin domain-containing protein [Emticicia sp. CRIBPO]NBA85199.1 cupin domain-containing protein [Emticicia sp. CRIBPO]
MQRRKFLIQTTATVSLLALKAEALTTTPKPFTVKAGEARFGIHTPFRGINVNDMKISGKDTNGQLAVFEYIGKEKTGPVLHVHHDQDEIFSIIEGEYLFQVGDNKFTVKAGDTVFAPMGVPHTWIQLSEEGKQVYMVQPAGKLEEFFLKLNELKGPPTEELIQKMHKSHGMTVVGPPLTLKQDK